MNTTNDKLNQFISNNRSKGIFNKSKLVNLYKKVLEPSLRSNVNKLNFIIEEYNSNLKEIYNITTNNSNNTEYDRRILETKNDYLTNLLELYNKIKNPSLDIDSAYYYPELDDELFKSYLKKWDS